MYLFEIRATKCDVETSTTSSPFSKDALMGLSPSAVRSAAAPAVVYVKIIEFVLRGFSNMALPNACFVTMVRSGAAAWLSSSISV